MNKWDKILLSDIWRTPIILFNLVAMASCFSLGNFTGIINILAIIYLEIDRPSKEELERIKELLK